MATALEIVLEQATEKADLAAKTLASTRQQLTAARKKLEMLEDYERETAQSLSTPGQQTGFTGFQLRNQNAFRAKISSALSQQRQQVHFFEQTEAHHLKQWQLALQEQKKYQALLDRQAKEKLALEAKRDQKMNDEFAARIHRVRLSGESA